MNSIVPAIVSALFFTGIVLLGLHVLAWVGSP